MESKAYRLYKNGNLIGVFNSIIEAKSNTPEEDGDYKLIGNNYKDYWTVFDGKVHNR